MNLGMSQAWHTAKFVLGMYGGSLKGKKLSDFLIGDREDLKDTKAAQAIAFFHSMMARGLPVKIERVERKAA